MLDRRCRSRSSLVRLHRRLVDIQDFPTINCWHNRHCRRNWNPKHRRCDFLAHVLTRTANRRLDDGCAGLSCHYDAVPVTWNVSPTEMHPIVSRDLFNFWNNSFGGCQMRMVSLNRLKTLTKLWWRCLHALYILQLYFPCDKNQNRFNWKQFNFHSKNRKDTAIIKQQDAAILESDQSNSSVYWKSITNFLIT